MSRKRRLSRRERLGLLRSALAGIAQGVAKALMEEVLKAGGWWN